MHNSLGFNFAEKRDAQLLRPEVCERLAPVDEGPPVRDPNFRGARKSNVKQNGNFLIVSHY